MLTEWVKLEAKILVLRSQWKHLVKHGEQKSHRLEKKWSLAGIERKLAKEVGIGIQEGGAASECREALEESSIF